MGRGGRLNSTRTAVWCRRAWYATVLVSACPVLSNGWSDCWCEQLVDPGGWGDCAGRQESPNGVGVTAVRPVQRNATTEARKESEIAYAQKASVVTGVLPVEQKACVGKNP